MGSLARDSVSCDKVSTLERCLRRPMSHAILSNLENFRRRWLRRRTERQRSNEVIGNDDGVGR